MKKSFLIGISFLLFGCVQKPPMIREYPPQELMGMLRNGFAIVIDTREGLPPESEKIEGSIPVTQTSVLDGTLMWPNIPKDKELVCLGMTGEFGRQCAEVFTKKGYKAGYLLSLDSWKKAGFPTVK